MNNIIDMIGQKFGRLTVLKMGRGKDGRLQWWCKCDCGKEGLHNGTALRKGIIKSCGCYNKDRIREATSKRPNCINGPINKLIAAYKLSASKRGLYFSIDLKRFKKITSQNCFYCDCPPSQVVFSGRYKYVYNGIDRVDNEIGYVNGNIIPCCKKCNYSKSDGSQQDFYLWAKRVYNNLMVNKIIGDNHAI